MNKKGIILIVAIVLVVGIFVAAAIIVPKLEEIQKPMPTKTPTPTGTATQTPPPKEEAIDFKLTTLDGREVSLSDYKGKAPVVLNFWASWCGPCKSEMPHFYETSTQYDESELVFLMVNLTDGDRETEEKAKAYLEENNLPFKNVLLDKEGTAGYIYGIASIPTTIFVDKEGYVVAGYKGAMTEEMLLRGVDLLLNPTE